jgi:uncharacterized protein with PQ loop repeat
MSDPLQFVGLAGIALSCLAYMPQVLHLVKEHCAAGVSVRAWLLWMVAGVLIGAHAVSKGDVVFIILQIVNVGAAATIAALGQRYRCMRCEAHQHQSSDADRRMQL